MKLEFSKKDEVLAAMPASCRYTINGAPVNFPEGTKKIVCEEPSAKDECRSCPTAEPTGTGWGPGTRFVSTISK